jgi:mannose-1-phosphate guanylyltransferase
MKAFLLAAGEGKRLGELTKKTPKCLLPIGGKPLLEIWLEICEKFHIQEVLINGHYLHQQVERYLEKNRNNFSLKINYIYESELKGTGGTVRDNFDFVEKEEFFFIFHADNFTNINLTEFKKFHLTKKALLSLALYYTTLPEQCGIVEKMDKEGRILTFREKPLFPSSNLASAALFLASPLIKKDFPPRGKFDFSKEILPRYEGKMFGYLIKGFNIDIGTPENYRKAQELAKIFFAERRKNEED